MYRIFCESYKNYIDSFDKDCYRLQLAKPFELIVNLDKLKKEKEKQSNLYKEMCDLVNFLKNNIEKYPKLKAFLWTLDSRNIKPKQYNISNKEDLEEQTKLINSFLNLAYWY